MGHAFLFVPHANKESSGFEVGCAALACFKQVKFGNTANSAQARLAVASGTKTVAQVHWSKDGKVCLASLGTWLSIPAEKGRDAAWLLTEYARSGVLSLAKQLQGLFALIIIDQNAGQTHVITDRCGSLHLYWHRGAEGNAVCTSSAALAISGNATLDPVATHEFIATGIIYEDRSLWKNISKIAPSSVLTFDGAGERIQQYWGFGEVKAESLVLDQAVDQAFDGLVQVLRALPETSAPMVSDLTGGYDSRLLLAGLMSAGRDFETTVSGSSNHPDVRVAAQIAQVVKIRHQNVSAAAIPSAELWSSALALTDGEYDVFDYARILDIHRQLADKYGMSLNGSFGELGRGYWWELLWPKLAQQQALDTHMLARKRFAAIPYDRSVFDGEARIDLAEHMSQVIQRAVRPIADLPNTTQMDCAYYTLRMQRWQGRIASSTNQLWSSFSPVAFSQVLDPILSAQARGRFRSLMVRRLFQRHAPLLAKIPLEHGYPPVPASATNLYRFYPLIGHYGAKVWGKVSARLPGKRTTPAPVPALRPELQLLVRDTSLRDWLQSPMLLESGLFREDALNAMLAAGINTGSRHAEQWRRLVTLEALLQRVTACRANIDRT